MSRMRAIQIFKPGRHTAASGETLEFGDDHVKAIVAAYDPAKHEAPIVVGHPRTDAPAYGWVKSLDFLDGALAATPSQVDPQFAELVAAGRYKKISASFFKPDAKNNPVPGVYYLRHVGFLGAVPPAVKGLKNPEFAADEEGVIEFGDWDDRINAGLWRKLRDWMIAQFGMDQADKVIPDYHILGLEESALTPDSNMGADALPSYSESTPAGDPAMSAEQDAIKAQKADLDARAIKIKADEDRLAAAARDANRRDTAQFAEDLIKAGKLLPVDKAGLVEFMAGIDAGTVVEFGEGDAKTSKPAGEWLRAFLQRLPKQVDFSEAAGAEANEGAVDFAVPQGFEVDREQLALHAKATAYAKKNNVDFVEAYKAVGGK